MRGEIRAVSVDDAAAVPLLADLQQEYTTLYPDYVHLEMSGIAAADFAAPDGSFLVLLEDGVTIAGGAFRRHDDSTAEFKRIWTAPAHRRRGLARRVLAELEREAQARGYSRVYLVTGPRQPAARELYLSSGYTPLFDVDADPLTIGPLPFEKPL